MTELILADLQSAETQHERQLKKARGQDKEAIANVALLERLIPHLNEGRPASLLSIQDEERARLNSFHLLSLKPVIFACNVSEDDILNPGANPLVSRVQKHVREQHDAGIAVICSKLEEDVSEMTPEEAIAFLEEMGVTDSGVSQLIQATYDLLGLASYFTMGEKEVRAWTFRKGMKAPECAGVIHTDFEKGFIKAEVLAYDDLMQYGSKVAAREAGRVRIEGKEYIFKDGDITEFRFSS